MLRAMVILLIVLAMFGVFSAVTGIQSINADPRLGTVMTYHHGLGRVYAAGFAVVCIALVYAIYRRHVIAWWIGLIGWIGGALQMMFMIWRDLSRTGFWSAVAACVSVVAVSVYWSHRWYRQKSYFS